VPGESIMMLISVASITLAVHRSRTMTSYDRNNTTILFLHALALVFIRPYMHYVTTV